MPTNPTADYWTKLEAERDRLREINAELVAALEATQAILGSILNNPETAKGIGSLFAGAQKWEAQARAALAKAKGE